MVRGRSSLAILAIRRFVAKGWFPAGRVPILCKYLHCSKIAEPSPAALLSLSCVGVRLPGALLLCRLVHLGRHSHHLLRQVASPGWSTGFSHSCVPRQWRSFGRSGVFRCREQSRSSSGSCLNWVESSPRRVLALSTGPVVVPS